MNLDATIKHFLIQYGALGKQTVHPITNFQRVSINLKRL